MFPDDKSSNHASLPTPFRKRKKSSPMTDVHPPNIQHGSAHVCMFPDCKNFIDGERLETHAGVKFQIGVKREYSNARLNRDILSFVACDAHSHLMKKRKMKRKVAFQQHSHMKNLMGTIMHIMRRSISASLSKLGEEADRQQKA